MKKHFLFFALAAVYLVSCTASQKKVPALMDSNSPSDVVDMHTAENALDYLGTYQGVVSTAACAELQLRLVLNADRTYAESKSCKDGATVDVEGSFLVKKNLLTLVSSQQDTSYFKVEENQLRLSDSQGKPISGSDAEQSILIKQQ